MSVKVKTPEQMRREIIKIFYKHLSNSFGAQYIVQEFEAIEITKPKVAKKAAKKKSKKRRK